MVKKYIIMYLVLTLHLNYLVEICVQTKLTLRAGFSLVNCQLTLTRGLSLDALSNSSVT